MNIYKTVDGKQLRRSVIVFIERSDRKFLCMKRHPNLRSYPGEWSFCGGKCDEEDENTLRAAMRELKEETGIDVGDLHFHSMQPYDQQFEDVEAGYSIKFYILRIPTFKADPIVTNPAEHTDHFWCPIELGLNVLTEKIPESRKFFKQYYNL